MEEPTKKERIAGIVSLIVFVIIMGGIIYLGLTNPIPTDNSDMMMEMMP